MPLGLVIIDETNTVNQLVHTSADWATGAEAKIILLRIVDEDEYISDIQQKAQSQGNINSLDELLEKESERIKEIRGSQLGHRDIETGMEVKYGKLPDDILEYARDMNADHLFITGERRSPVGKAIFGDDLQKLLLNFDGPVTSIIGGP